MNIEKKIILKLKRMMSEWEKREIRSHYAARISNGREKAGQQTFLAAEKIEIK